MKQQKTEKKLYPLGSVIYLEEGNQKIMIIGRGVVYHDEDSKQEVYVDYMGCEYPIGMNPDNVLFFNHENIDKLIFRGYHDEDEDRYQELYEEWEENVEYPKKKI